MKKQNVFNLFAVGALVVALAFGVQSCKKDDPCDDVTCQNGGTCDDGNCSCPTGYEGTLCENAWNERYTGSWNGTACGFNETFTVTASSEPNKFIVQSATNWFDCDLNGTFDEPYSFVCTINSDKTTFTINSTNRCSNIWAQTGNGSVNGSLLSLNITSTATGGGGTFTCNWDLNKQ